MNLVLSIVSPFSVLVSFGCLLPPLPQRCAWIPLHNIDFVSFTTYYWVVATDNTIDDYLANMDIDSEDEETWVAEVGEGVPETRLR